MLSRLLVVAALILPAVAQEGAPRPPTPSRVGNPQQTAIPDAMVMASKPEDLGFIEGKVLDAITGEPVKKADLRLSRAGQISTASDVPAAYAGTTDASGQFQFNNIEPAEYRLVVTKAGYVRSEYGTKGPGKPGILLRLAAKQKITGADLKLTPHAVITGRVVDADGDPMMNVQVMTARFRYVNGRRQLAPAIAAVTNDIGEFRIFGITPGRYYLSASYRAPEMDFISQDRSNVPPPEEGFVTTYYPASTDPKGGVALDAQPGMQLRGIEIRMSKTRTVRVRGRIVTDPTVGAREFTVFLVPHDSIGAVSVNQAQFNQTEGRFELRGVAPGSYTLVARATNIEQFAPAKIPLEVTGMVDNLVIPLGEGARVLRGAVKLENSGSPNPASFRLTLRSTDQLVLPTQRTQRLYADGAFSFGYVTPDRYRITFANLPEGHYLKSIRVGDQEVLESGLDVSASGMGSVQILISGRAGHVDGAVKNEKDEAAPGSTVVLVPESTARRVESTFYRTATSDQFGNFQFRSVDPGEYKIYAWDDVESDAWMDAEFMQPLEAGGKKVSVKEGSTETVEVKRIAAP